MMTTLPIVSKALHGLPFILVFALIIVFAVIDQRTKRVPNKGLALFLPVVLISTLTRFYCGENWDSVLLYLIFCCAGALLGGGVLLASAMITHGGIGGGDIKLTALIGLFYGPYEILFVLLIGTLVASLYGLILGRQNKEKKLHIAFVPFIALGVFVITLKGIFTI